MTAKTTDGMLYISYEQVQAWQARIDALAASLSQLAAEVRQSECIQITTHKGVPAPATKGGKAPAKAPAKPKASARKPAPKPSKAEVDKAAGELEAATKAARPELEGPPIRNGKVRQRPMRPRQRFGKLREQLIVDHGQEVADRMVDMCGDDKVTLVLRKQVQKFVGTFADKDEAAQGYAKAVGLEDGDVLEADTILADVTAYRHENGKVSVWAKDDDIERLRRQRQQEGIDDGDFADEEGEAEAVAQ